MTDIALLRSLARPWPSPVTKRVVRVASPATATDLTITVPGQYVWLPVALRFTLTVANSGSARRPNLKWSDGTDTIGDYVAPNTVPINDATAVSFLPNVQTGTADTTNKTNSQLLPSMALPAGWTIGTRVAGLTTGDAITNVRLTVVEMFTGNVEHERQIEDAIVSRLDAIHELIEQGVQ